jgi:hypothetical protein
VASLLERVEARAVFFRKSLPLVLSSYRHEFTDQQKKWLDLATADMSYDDRIRLLSILKRALQTHLAEDAEKSTPG